MSLFELTYLSVSGNDAIGNGRRAQKKKKSTPTSTFLIFVKCFYCSGRINLGHCSLAPGKFLMLVSSQNNELMLFYK